MVLRCRHVRTSQIYSKLCFQGTSNATSLLPSTEKRRARRQRVCSRTDCPTTSLLRSASWDQRPQHRWPKFTVLRTGEISTSTGESQELHVHKVQKKDRVPAKWKSSVHRRRDQPNLTRVGKHWTRIVLNRYVSATQVLSLSKCEHSWRWLSSTCYCAARTLTGACCKRVEALQLVLLEYILKYV